MSSSFLLLEKVGLWVVEVEVEVCFCDENWEILGKKGKKKKRKKANENG